MCSMVYTNLKVGDELVDLVERSELVDGGVRLTMNGHCAVEQQRREQNDSGCRQSDHCQHLRQ